MELFPWLQKLSKELLSFNDSPLLGQIPFPWEDFSKKLAEQMRIEGCEIKPHSTKWEPFERSDEMQIFSFQVAPLSGELFWIMDQKEMVKLVALFTFSETQDLGFSSQILQEGYYHFLLTQSLDLICSYPLFKDFSAQMKSDGTLPGFLLSREIQITYQEKSVYGKLALSAEFQQSWASYIKSHPPSPTLWEKALSIPLSVIIAEVEITKENLESCKKGSYLLLDEITYNPDTNQGSATLVAESIPLFSLSIEDSKATIKKAMQPEEKPMAEETTSIDQLPVTLSIELAKFSYPLEKILQLEEGHTLELPTPTQKISITANGKKIASGELIYIGDRLSVRIEEIGK